MPTCHWDMRLSEILSTWYSVPYWDSTFVSRYFAFLDRIVTLQVGSSLLPLIVIKIKKIRGWVCLWHFLASRSKHQVVPGPTSFSLKDSIQEKSLPEVSWVELFKDSWDEVWSPIGNQVVPSENVPGQSERLNGQCKLRLELRSGNLASFSTEPFPILCSRTWTYEGTIHNTHTVQYFRNLFEISLTIDCAIK